MPKPALGNRSWRLRWPEARSHEPEGLPLTNAIAELLERYHLAPDIAKHVPRRAHSSSGVRERSRRASRRGRDGRPRRHRRVRPLFGTPTTVAREGPRTRAASLGVLRQLVAESEPFRLACP